MPPPSLPNPTLTAVPGLAVGHADDASAATGCTVVLGPFRAAVDVRGLAAGTRQLDSLSPNHLASRVDALLLTGGSAYGLAAADGVAGWLEEQGRGLETDVGTIAIVPTAVIFDLGVGRADRRPDPAMGRAACEAADRSPVEEGRVGVGVGASVGKLLGRANAMPGGVGSHAAAFDGHVVGALVVVNAFGDVVDERGRIIAGARDRNGDFVDTAAYLRDVGPPPRFVGNAGTNTTLAVVASDYPLGRTELQAVAQQAMNAIARRISPANSQYDGDLVFACSTGLGAGQVEPAQLLRLGVTAEWVLARAIERAVRGARPGDRPELKPN
jgi:L-aminopeptidase/D-esterase-like protein